MLFLAVGGISCRNSVIYGRRLVQRNKPKHQKNKLLTLWIRKRSFHTAKFVWFIIIYWPLTLRQDFDS